MKADDVGVVHEEIRREDILCEDEEFEARYSHLIEVLFQICITVGRLYKFEVAVTSRGDV